MEKWYKQGQELLDEIRDTNLSETELALWHIGQCGYICKYGTKVLLIDPVLNDICGQNGQTRRHYPAPFGSDALCADYVLCTHGHIDHMAPETLRGIMQANPDAWILIPAGCVSLAEEMGLPSDRLLPMEDGLSRDLTQDISAAAFSAAHPTHVREDSDPDMALGYCVSFGDIHLVHLGDTFLTTDLLSSLEKLPTPNVFLPPINGDDCFREMRNCIGNMEAEEAAKLAARLGADLSMPTHFDMIMDNTVDPLRFAAELRRINPAARWHIPALGERILYKL